MILKALQWFGKAYMQTFGFCLAIAMFVGFLMTLIAYPVQTIATILIGSFVVLAFMFFFRF